MAAFMTRPRFSASIAIILCDSKSSLNNPTPYFKLIPTHPLTISVNRIITSLTVLVNDYFKKIWKICKHLNIH